MIYDRKCFLVSLGIIGLTVFPLLISNIYYLDDLYRVVWGFTGWDGDGRPFSQFFYRILTLRSHMLPDLFPAPLILSIVFLCFVFSLLSEKFGNRKSILFALCICSLILNPLFNANLHFRYDSSFMVLSIAFALLPFCVLSKNKIISFFLSCLFITLSLTSYQVSINIFITFSLIELLHGATRGDIKGSVVMTVNRMGGLIVGYIFYSKIIIGLTSVNAYFSEYSRIISFDKDGGSKLAENLSSSFSLLYENQNFGFKIFILSIILVYVLSLIDIIFRNHKIINVPFLLLSWVITLLLSIFFIPGVTVFSENPLFMARGYVGFGGFIAAMLIPVCWVSFKYIRYLILISYIYMIGFSYAANNAMKLENAHIENVAIRIINDIENNSNGNEIKYINVDGELQHNESAKVAVVTYPLINSMLPRAFYYKYDVGQFVLNRLGLPDIRYTNSDSRDGFKECSSKKSRYYYDICFGGNNTAYITFK